MLSMFEKSAAAPAPTRRILMSACHHLRQFRNIVSSAYTPGRQVATSREVESVFLFITEPQRKTGTGDARQSGISRVWWRERPFQAALGWEPLLTMPSRP